MLVMSSGAKICFYRSFRVRDCKVAVFVLQVTDTAAPIRAETFKIKLIPSIRRRLLSHTPLPSNLRVSMHRWVRRILWDELQLAKSNSPKPRLRSHTELCRLLWEMQVSRTNGPPHKPLQLEPRHFQLGLSRLDWPCVCWLKSIVVHYI